MQFLFAPAKRFLRPLKNQVKLPVLLGFFLAPSVVSALAERSPATQQVATALYVFACYMMAGHYYQVQDSWISLLGMMRSLAKGNLVTEVQGKIGGQFLMGHVKMVTVVNNLGVIVGQATTGAQRIAEAARDMSGGIVDLSQRTEEQAATLEQTAAGMEQLATTVKANADNCKAAETLAGRANTVAAQGGQMVEVLVETMSGIEKSAKKVADIISVIEGIAFQTNILALNAAVEAARAGERGRGFAVVAVEVRNLAQRSGTAAKEIKDLIGESVASVERGGKLVDETGRIINDVVASVKEVSARIGAIAAASAEQSAGVEEINRSIIQLESVTQQNAALVEQATAAAMAFEEEAAKLAQTVQAFTGAEAQAAPAAAAPERASTSGAARAVRSPAASRPPARIAAGAGVLALSSKPAGAPRQPAGTQRYATDDGEMEEF